jgi:hypothetical protein
MSAEQARRINLLVERLVHEPALRERYATDRAAVLAEAGIDPAHAAALAAGDMSSLTQIGMHPILQMHYQMVLHPHIAAHMTVRHYPEFVEGC